MVAFRRPRNLLRCTALGAAALALVLTACSKDEPLGNTPVGTTTATSSPATSGPATSAAPARTELAAKAWSEMWSGAAARTPEGDAAATAVSSPDLVQKLQTRLRLPGTAPTFPVTTEQPDGTVAISDCVVPTPFILENSGSWWTGTAAPGADGVWRVTAANLHVPEPCVPATLAKAAIDKYTSYWDAQHQWWNPPDSSNALLGQYLVSPQLERTMDVLTNYASKNAVLKGSPQLHPEISQVRSATEVVVRDCQVWDPSFGIFDRTSGARIAGIDQLDPNQPRYLATPRLVLRGDGWRIAELQGSKLTLEPGQEVACDFAPSSRGLPQV